MPPLSRSTGCLWAKSRLHAPGQRRVLLAVRFGRPNPRPSQNSEGHAENNRPDPSAQEAAPRMQLAVATTVSWSRIGSQAAKPSPGYSRRSAA